VSSLLQFMEFLILEWNGQIRSIPSSCLSITGLAACTRKELFASTSNDYAPVVNIWKWSSSWCLYKMWEMGLEHKDFVETKRRVNNSSLVFSW